MPNITGARSYVDVPAPAPKVGGLFPVVRIIDSTDPHDLLGAEYQTDACTPAEHWSAGNCGYGYPATPCNPTPDPAATLKDFHGLTLVTGDPFTVYDGIDCELIGAPADHYAARVEASLLLKEQKVVETHLDAMLMAMATDITPGGSPVNVTQGVAGLEAWLAANYEGAGLIHMSRPFAVYAGSLDLVDVGLDGTLATMQGTPVANGAGYTASPDGFIFATGQITLIRGPIDVRIVPGAQNGLTCDPPRALAERTYVPLIECGAAKMEVVRPTAQATVLPA